MENNEYQENMKENEKEIYKVINNLVWFIKVIKNFVL